MLGSGDALGVLLVGGFPGRADQGVDRGPGQAGFAGGSDGVEEVPCRLRQLRSDGPAGRGLDGGDPLGDPPPARAQADLLCSA